MLRIAFNVIVSVLILTQPSAVCAEPVKDLEAKMNESRICSPIKFDARAIARMLGYNVPNLPIDMSVGFDKNAHKVKSFGVDAARELSVGLELGCQPSREGQVLRLLNIRPDQLRLSEDVVCNGIVVQNGAVRDFTCRPSGEVGKLLGAITDLNGQMSAIVQSVITAR